jgi:hypothetical protein
MSTRNMLIIRNANGSIIAAQVEDPYDADVQTFISPADPQHTLHMVADVPAEICDLADPAEFHRAVSAHVTSGDAKIAVTSAEELHARFSQALASRGR